MDIEEMEIYHTPTQRNITCLCLDKGQFLLDCEEYILDRYRTYSVNPKERFYAKIDGLTDQIVRDVKKLPFSFSMRLEGRHSRTGKPVYYAFRALPRESLGDSSVFHERIEETQKHSHAGIDFIIVYTGARKG